MASEAGNLGGVDTEFWCNVCDNRKVRSQDRKTGKFFYQDGHIWKGVQHQNPISESVMVVYAVCVRCLVPKKSLTVKEIYLKLYGSGAYIK